MIPLSQPDVGQLEISLVNSTISDGWISGNGPQVDQFERMLAARLQRREVIATANGTMALELALRALGVGTGDDVIVPAFTFATPALTVLALGAIPVLADIDPMTWTIDPQDVASKLT